MLWDSGIGVLGPLDEGEDCEDFNFTDDNNHNYKSVNYFHTPATNNDRHNNSNDNENNQNMGNIDDIDNNENNNTNRNNNVDITENDDANNDNHIYNNDSNDDANIFESSDSDEDSITNDKQKNKSSKKNRNSVKNENRPAYTPAKISTIRERKEFFKKTLKIHLEIKKKIETEKEIILEKLRLERIEKSYLE